MTPTTFEEFVILIIDLINLIVPALLAFVFIYLVWKIFDAWVINAGDEKKIEEGKSLALTAVLVLVVMITVWGIVAMLKTSFFG